MADDTLDEPVWVYKITCKVNGKAYIGITVKSVEHRWRQHINTANRLKTSRPFLNAVKKYGAENFSVSTVYEATSAKEAGMVERALIAEHNTFIPNGYNITTGAEFLSGRRHSKATRKLISENQKGRKHTEDAKRKIAEASKNRVTSDETRKKRSVARKGMKLNAEWCANISRAGKGRFVSEETRNKMSVLKKGHEVNDETRRKIGAKHKGKILSVDTKMKISAALKGRRLSEEHKKKIRENKHVKTPAELLAFSEKMKGHLVSEETRQKIRIANTGKKRNAAYSAYASSRSKSMWSDPDMRAKIIAAQNVGKEKRRNETAGGIAP